MRHRIIEITLIASIFLNLTACASSTAFSRYKGTALKYSIPIHQGQPPEEYTYESLGYVKGEYKSGFFDSAVYTISKALENMADNAKDMGANAVINVKGHNESGGFSYGGEAVIFDALPDE